VAKRLAVSGRGGAIERLAGALGHRFANSALLEQALRHASAAHEQGVPSFERLEFLGDAALSHAIAALLFKNWPDASEGDLTRARAALVCEASLARLADGVGLAEAIQVGSGLHEERASAALLADAFEATLGALLLDGGWRAFSTAVRRLFAPLLGALDPAQLALTEPKTTLQELAQRQGLPLPVYQQVETRGPAHRRVYVYEVEFGGCAVGRGEGSSKKAAQQQAARHALTTLTGE
jgi:ribonuclease-3